MKHYRVIISPGEPAGIGPDLVIKLSQYNWPVELVVCADNTLLQQRSVMLNLPLTLLPYKSSNLPIPQKSRTLTLLHIPLNTPVVPGKLCKENSYYIIKSLKRACDGCMNGEFSALITGPVHKGIINKAGISFTGHTEFFEKYSNSQKTVMMLDIEKIRVALVTTHLPIKLISNIITRELLCKTIDILNHDLCIRFGIFKPRILVCGLNPHAGEDGYIGTEEINTIIPAIKEMQNKGISIEGPLPADTIFQSKYINNFDVILAMYHDQGLPVIKHLGFTKGVNVTLGLPFIRTSVDHGTALDLVGHNKASADSFIAAINLAIKMIFNIYE